MCWEVIVFISVFFVIVKEGVVVEFFLRFMNGKVEGIFLIGFVFYLNFFIVVIYNVFV